MQLFYSNLSCFELNFDISFLELCEPQNRTVLPDSAWYHCLRWYSIVPVDVFQRLDLCFRWMTHCGRVNALSTRCFAVSVRWTSPWIWRCFDVIAQPACSITKTLNISLHTVASAQSLARLCSKIFRKYITSRIKKREVFIWQIYDRRMKYDSNFSPSKAMCIVRGYRGNWHGFI